MLNKYISSSIKNQFPLKLTELQTVFYDKISDYITNVSNDNLFILKGYAGTGKTTLIANLVKSVKKHKVDTILLAPTGRAAKIFSKYANKTAWTIHKHIYRQRSETDGIGIFDLSFNKAKNTLFIIDEASMLANYENTSSFFGSGRLLDDVISFIFDNKNNNKLLLVGDTAQLPPVGLSLSHALDTNYLENNYHKKVSQTELTEIIRQKAEYGILDNATLLRSYITEKVSKKLLIDASKDDVHNIKGSELIDELSEAYDKYGEEETIVITRSNKRANAYNQGIRGQVLYRDGDITVGDFLMIVKNNYYWKSEDGRLDFIANGEIAEVVDYKCTQKLYGFLFADVVMRFINYDIEIETKILLDTLTVESPALTQEQNKELYYNILEDYSDIKTKRKRNEALRKDPYFNALQVKFAYAVTCHKAQGGQWDAVFIDQGYLTDEMLDADYYRWLYTAITRAKKELFFVNFKDKYQKK